MAQTSLDVRQQHNVQWTIPGLTTLRMRLHVRRLHRLHTWAVGIAGRHCWSALFYSYNYSKPGDHLSLRTITLSKHNWVEDIGYWVWGSF
jgi:hypothetical protein